jgi:hypothetical protein
MYGYAPGITTAYSVVDFSYMPRLMSSCCGVSKMCVTLQNRVTRVIAENVKTARVPNWLVPQHLTLR